MDALLLYLIGKKAKKSPANDFNQLKEIDVIKGTLRLKLNVHQVVLSFVYEECVTFCQGDACVDKLSDCAEYTESSCKAPYVSWAYNNCKAFCGFCRKY